MKMNRLFSLLLFFSFVQTSFAQMYIAVLSKGSAGHQQVYSIHDRFPEEKFMEYRKDGYFIDDISYGGEVWTIAASDKMGLSDQKAIASEEFPTDEINNMASQGYFVTNITYGKSLGARTWGVILTQGGNVESQVLLEGDEFPIDEVQEKLLEDYRVMDVAVGQDKCRVIMAKGKKLKIVSQEAYVSDEFPEQFIKDKTNREFPSVITHLSYQNNKWYIVTSFGTEFNSQYYTMQKALPTNTITDGWKEGYLVTEFQKFFYKNEKVVGSLPTYLAEYKGRKNCEEIMSESNYKKLGTSIATITIADIEGDKEKLLAINNFLEKQKVCMSTQQAAALTNYFEYDESRYEFIELIYKHIYDVDNMPGFEGALGENEELIKKFKKLLKE